ncbi:MAG: hypothetical protein IJJ84_13505 [Kiritimatiellae bacterium]|nr:hypothetical protein [Kiritimatiellia bacterium]
MTKLTERARFGYELIALLAVAFCVLVGASTAFGAPTFGVVDGKYVVDVPANEDYTLTADDVATMMNEDNVAYPLAKKGGGTLIVGAVMAEYPNDIYILDGQYKATAVNSFGTTTGITYVDGGTLWSTRDAPNTWTASGGSPAFGAEIFHLKGTGYNNLGAIRQTNGYCQNFAAAGKIILDGDIRVTGTTQLEFRYGSIYCNSNTIFVAMDNENALFRFVALSVNTPGSIKVESGKFGFESSTGEASSTYSVTLEPGAQLYLNNALHVQRRTLWLKDGTRMSIGNGYFGLGSITVTNQWAGPMTIDGITPVQFTSMPRGLNLSAPISGAGGFAAYGGGYLQFANPDNTFAGGVSVTGKVGAVAGAVTGGVSVVKTTSAGSTYMTPFAAIPTNGAPIRLNNAQLGVFNARIAEFPDVIADGRCAVTGTPLLVKGRLKSLTKTGADELTIYGPFHVAGATDVQGGTLRFGTRVPDVPTGLNWYYSWGKTSGNANTTIPATVPFQCVEPKGAAYAYQGWPSTTGADNAPTHLQAHYYTGYIRIPGEEGEEVTCNFVSSFARYTYLVIDGKRVVQVDDNKDSMSNTIIGYARFYVGPPVTLTAGWKTFFLRLGNTWNASVGPSANTDLGWVSNFGIGVDWQGRCVTNSANYVKFLDPGDGSFLRPTLAGKADVDPAGYPRPSFGGAVAFGPGTVFDVGDVAPYTPVTVPSLTGVPTITNGSVSVASSTWTLRAADVAGGVPLTIASNAELTFPAGTVTVDIPDADLLKAQGVKTGRAILKVAEGASFPANAFVVSATVKDAHWRVDPDGDTLRLNSTEGVALILR